MPGTVLILRALYVLTIFPSQHVYKVCITMTSAQHECYFAICICSSISRVGFHLAVHLQIRGSQVTHLVQQIRSRKAVFHVQAGTLTSQRITCLSFHRITLTSNKRPDGGAAGI